MGLCPFPVVACKVEAGSCPQKEKVAYRDGLRKESLSCRLHRCKKRNGKKETSTGSNTTRILTAGMKTLIIPPDYSGITIPEKPKLKFLEKVPNVPKARREPKNLRDICGPSLEATEFTEGQYGIMALDGGYLRWEHMEMMRLTINRHLNPKTMFAVWRIPAPYKPVTRKGLGHRMGGGKGAIAFYVTAVKSGRLLVEVGGHCEFSQVEYFLNQVVKKLPFKAKAVSRKSLQEMREIKEERRRSNQNPWTFERIIKANMLGVRKHLSPYDLTLKGCYWGRFYLPDRI
ncbi:large ribosomal subunit protein uL16m isoform X2 [Pogona vitticeps]